MRARAGNWSATKRRNRAGNSFRRARSPVPPNSTRSKFCKRVGAPVFADDKQAPFDSVVPPIEILCHMRLRLTQMRCDRYYRWATREYFFENPEQDSQSAPGAVHGAGAARGATGRPGSRVLAYSGRLARHRSALRSRQRLCRLRGLCSLARRGRRRWSPPLPCSARCPGRSRCRHPDTERADANARISIPRTALASVDVPPSVATAR